MAQEKLCSQEKRISAGLLAAAGHYQLNDNVRDYVQQKAAAVKQKEYEKHLRKKDEYDVLFAQVQAIRLQNLPYNMWTQAHLRTMIKWFKRDGDEKLPSKKSEQITRYLATCHRGDLPAPMLPDGFAAVVLPLLLKIMLLCQIMLPLCLLWLILLLLCLLYSKPLKKR